MHTENRLAARKMDLALVQMIKKMMAQSRQCAAARAGSPISRDGIIPCMTSIFSCLRRRHGSPRYVRTLHVGSDAVAHVREEEEWGVNRCCPRVFF